MPVKLPGPTYTVWRKGGKPRPYEMQATYKTRRGAYARFFEDKNHPCTVEVKVFRGHEDVTAEFEAEYKAKGDDVHEGQGLVITTKPDGRMVAELGRKA